MNCFSCKKPDAKETDPMARYQISLCEECESMSESKMNVFKSIFNSTPYFPWISTADRLPEVDKYGKSIEVIFLQQDSVYVGTYNVYSGCAEWWHNEGIIDPDKIKYWMHIPELPPEN